ncbi:hypothetical protein B0T20DRAFT_359552 [Sordaria brevicollis]|uniref:Uncharacterized protein n=1 Tax=Sordaria brevicollis TaxID=83679 RepID=A0AAE0P911_SORBR|nr:hypothetical protein B0T20DRAFT_359552 [Sordaria brevicollis]
MTGTVGSLLSGMTQAGEPPATSLVAIMIVTTASLLWCLSSWSGYSRRHFPYKVTLVTDILFFIPFCVFAILLGLPIMIHDGGNKCPQLRPTDKFIIEDGGPIGVLDFSGEPKGGRVPCTKLYLLWILTLVVTGSYILSTSSVGVIRSKEKKLEKALWCARAMGDPFAGSHRGPSPSEVSSVARLEQVVFARPGQEILPQPRSEGVQISTRSLDSGEAVDDDDYDDDSGGRRGGRFYCRDELYATSRPSPPRASRYDCTPRIDSSLDCGLGIISGRSLGDQALQGGKGEVDNNRKQHNRPGLAHNNWEITTKSPKKPIPLSVLRARSETLDQLEGRSSGSVDLADAPYYRDLFRFFAPQPDSSNLGLDPDPDRDSWATFSNNKNSNRYNRRLRTPKKLKNRRPSGFLFSPRSNVTPRSPAYPSPSHRFDLDSVLTVESNPYQNITTPTYSTHAPGQTQIPTQPLIPAQAQPQTQGGNHDSYSSSFYSQPSNYSNAHFDHRDLPSPLNPPPIPRYASGAAAGVQYSLPPTPRSTVRVVNKETLNKLEGITEESRSGSGGGSGSGSGNGDIGLEEIPITPSPSPPPQGQQQQQQLGEPSWRQQREGMTEWRPRRTEGQQQRWESGHGWESPRIQEPEQGVKHAGTFGENKVDRNTRWPGVWGLRSSVRNALRREQEEVDGQSTASSRKHRRHGGVGFRARSTKLFSTIGAWLNGIDDGHSFRSGRSGRGRREDNGWDMV